LPAPLRTLCRHADLPTRQSSPRRSSPRHSCSGLQPRRFFALLPSPSRSASRLAISLRRFCSADLHHHLRGAPASRLALALLAWPLMLALALLPRCHASPPPPLRRCPRQCIASATTTRRSGEPCSCASASDAGALPFRFAVMLPQPADPAAPIPHLLLLLLVLHPPRQSSAAAGHALPSRFILASCSSYDAGTLPFRLAVTLGRSCCAAAPIFSTTAQAMLRPPCSRASRFAAGAVPLRFTLTRSRRANLLDTAAAPVSTPHAPLLALCPHAFTLPPRFALQSAAALCRQHAVLRGSNDGNASPLCCAFTLALTLCL
jgi:hypothetical protein